MKIRFVHIPKTAGTAFSSLLSNVYKGNWFKFSGDIENDLIRFKNLNEYEKNCIIGIRGHQPLLTGVDIIDVLPTVTFLRDPVERVMSFCQLVSEGESPQLLEQYHPKNFQ